MGNTQTLQIPKKEGTPADFHSITWYLLTLLAFGIFLASVWIVRNHVVETTDATLFTSRLVKLCVYFILAFALRNRPLKLKTLFWFGLLFLVLSLAVTTMASISVGMDISYDLALEFVAAALSGIAEPILMLTFMICLTRYQVKYMAIGLAFAYLLGDVIYFSSTLMSAEIANLIISVGKVGAGALLFVVLTIGSPSLPKTYVDQKPNDKVISMPNNLGAVMLALVCGIVACMVCYGLFAQLAGSGQHDGLFDSASQIISLLVRLLIVVFCIYYGGRFELGALLAISIPLFLIGLAILPSNLLGEGLLVSGLFLKAGSNALTVLSLILALALARGNLSRSFFYVGLTLGAVSFTHVGRYIGYWLINQVVVDEVLVGRLALTGCAIIAAYLLVLYLKAPKISLSESKSALEKEELPALSGVADEVSACWKDPVARTSLVFCAKIERFGSNIGVSGREKEVLFEVAFGYTVDNIAEHLFLSRETVKTYLSRVYRKAGVSSRQDLLKAIDSFDFETESVGG